MCIDEWKFYFIMICMKVIVAYFSEISPKHQPSVFTMSIPTTGYHISKIETQHCKTSSTNFIKKILWQGAMKHPDYSIKAHWIW